MIKLPNQSKAWDYENNFYLTCPIGRIAKPLAHWELFKQVKDIPGDIVECGVFKGCAYIRWSMFRYLFNPVVDKKVIGFDTFCTYPDVINKDDEELVNIFKHDAFSDCISTEQLHSILVRKECDHNTVMVAGNILETVPEYVKNNPDMKISLLNLDTDTYESSTVIMNWLYPKISKGGILIASQYNIMPGETLAVNKYLVKNDIDLARMTPAPFNAIPEYIVV